MPEIGNSGIFADRAAYFTETNGTAEPGTIVQIVLAELDVLELDALDDDHRVVFQCVGDRVLDRGIEVPRSWIAFTAV